MTGITNFTFNTTDKNRGYAKTVGSDTIIAVECLECGEIKSVDNYSKGNSRGLPFYSYCKECAKKKRDEYKKKKEQEEKQEIKKADTQLKLDIDTNIETVSELTTTQKEMLEAFKKRNRDFAFMVQFTKDAVTVLEYVVKHEGILERL